MELSETILDFLLERKGLAFDEVTIKAKLAKAGHDVADFTLAMELLTSRGLVAESYASEISSRLHYQVTPEAVLKRNRGEV